MSCASLISQKDTLVCSALCHLGHQRRWADSCPRSRGAAERTAWVATETEVTREEGGLFWTGQAPRGNTIVAAGIWGEAGRCIHGGQHPSSEAYSSSGSLIPCILWNLKVEYCVYNGPTLIPVQNQINPVCALAFCLFKIHYDIIPCMPIPPSGVCLQVSPPKLYAFHFPSLHATCPTRLIILDLLWRLGLTEQSEWCSSCVNG